MAKTAARYIPGASYSSVTGSETIRGGRRSLRIVITGDLADEIVALQEGIELPGGVSALIRELVSAGIAALNPADPKEAAIVRGVRAKALAEARVHFMGLLSQFFNERTAEVESAYRDAKQAAAAVGQGR